MRKRGVERARYQSYDFGVSVPRGVAAPDTVSSICMSRIRCRCSCGWRQHLDSGCACGGRVAGTAYLRQLGRDAEDEQGGKVDGEKHRVVVGKVRRDEKPAAFR